MSTHSIARKLIDFIYLKPIICSLGNYAASGGYYIATNSKKVFALPTTVTGSIGVFGVKLDATKWAKR
jgi:protease-4